MSNRKLGYSVTVPPFFLLGTLKPNGYSEGLTNRRPKELVEEESAPSFSTEGEKLARQQGDKWKRILLLVIAVTVHNIPGDR